MPCVCYCSITGTRALSQSLALDAGMGDENLEEQGSDAHAPIRKRSNVARRDNDATRDERHASIVHTQIETISPACRPALATR